MPDLRHYPTGRIPLRCKQSSCGGIMDAHEIYLAGGCFWGTEAYLKKFPGIIDTEVGYVNASVENPSYEDVCTARQTQPKP